MQNPLRDSQCSLPLSTCLNCGGEVYCPGATLCPGCRETQRQQRKKQAMRQGAQEHFDLFLEWLEAGEPLTLELFYEEHKSLLEDEAPEACAQ